MHLRINITKLRIDLSPADSKRLQSASFLVGSNALEFQNKEIDKILLQGGMEPGQTETAEPVLFTPKMYGSVRSCVDYRKLNAMSKCDVYLIPRADMPIHSVAKVAVFSTIHANSGY